MLPFIDGLIAQTASNAYARPHQLLLTGDQIYADDVSDAMSLMLSDAGDILLGWTEQYPSFNGMQRPVTDLHPELRARLLHYVEGAGFTSSKEPLNYHLFGLGEYLTMYLFVWSDVLWPSGAATMPTFEELAAEFRRRISAIDLEELKGAIEGLPESRREPIKKAGDALQEFRKTLPMVRRTLANIPSYMIFDDHEVTDDWNMTRQFCSRVYGSELGLRIIQNALVAYSLCQHWGNVPENFLPAETTPPVGSLRPGASLLGLLDTPQPMTENAFQQKAADYDRVSKDIRKLLAVHDAAAVRGRADSAVYHDPDSLRYDFTVEGPSHQVIFTDTRTWRAFPKSADGTHLLTKNQQTDQFKQQILDAPPHAGPTVVGRTDHQRAAGTADSGRY
jgi:hypothetical protein